MAHHNLNDVFVDDEEQTSASNSQENAEERVRRLSDSMNPDPKVLDDLEVHARSISSNLDMALRDLRGALRGITDLSLESMQVFNTIVGDTCDSADAAIRSMYSMVAKAEELHTSLEGIQRLALQIKDMKRLVSTLESHFIESQST